MQTQYIGEILPDGHLSLPESLRTQFRTGDRLEVILSKVSEHGFESSSFSPESNSFASCKKSDIATERLLEGMHNAKDLGTPHAPSLLSHSTLLEERMDRKFP